MHFACNGSTFEDFGEDQHFMKIGELSLIICDQLQNRDETQVYSWEFYSRLNDQVYDSNVKLRNQLDLRLNFRQAVNLYPTSPQDLSTVGLFRRDSYNT